MNQYQVKHRAVGTGHARPLIALVAGFLLAPPFSGEALAEPMVPDSHRPFVHALPPTGSVFLAPQQGTFPPEPGTGRPGPPLRIGANVRVNDLQAFPFGRAEPTLAVGPNERRMVVGWNDAQGFCGPPFSDVVPLGCDIEVPGFTGYGYSVDGGSTFVDAGTPPLGDRIGFGPGPGMASQSGQFITLGDPTLDTGGIANRTYFFGNLSEFVDQVHVGYGPYPTGGVVVHIGAFRPFGGFEWGDAVLLQSPNYPLDFLDKPWVAADKRFDSSAVYATVTNFAEVGGIPAFGFGQIDAYASVDGGMNWTYSVIQPDETLSIVANAGVINQGSQPATGPDGTVYVAWERGYLSPFFGQAAAGVYPQIRVAVSHDGGQNWTPAAQGPPSSGLNPAGTLVADICAGALYPPAGYNRGNGNDYPRIAVAQGGRNAGRVYMVWADCRIAGGGTQQQTGGFGHPDTDIYLSFSDDRGETWSEPELVAGGGDGRLQFWPTVSVQADGDVDIVYYESVETDLQPANDQECVVSLVSGGGPPFRVSPVSSLVDVHYTQSRDGGASFAEPIAVTEQTTNWCAAPGNVVPNYGDYIDAVSGTNGVHATWADGRNGVPDVFFTNIRPSGR